MRNDVSAGTTDPPCCPVYYNCLNESISYAPQRKLKSYPCAMDVKSVMQRVIVRLWNRQYHLAFDAPDTVWTRLQRRGLKRIARQLTKLLESRM